MNINQISIIKNNKSYFNVTDEELKNIDHSIAVIIKCRNEICEFLEGKHKIIKPNDNNFKIINTEFAMLFTKLGQIKLHTEIIDNFILSKNQLLFNKFMEKSGNAC